MGYHTVRLHPHAKGISINETDRYMYQRHAVIYIDPDDADGAAVQLPAVAAV
jgi:hypothetical protein